MRTLTQEFLTGERALFGSKNLKIIDSVFADGESPLKESSNIELEGALFKWKYPLWYCDHITVTDSTLFDTARAGIWYTNDLIMKNVTIDAPKTFRRIRNMKLDHVTMPNAEETLWNCEQVKMEHVTANGEYFGMGCRDVTIRDFTLTGNYPFDGGRNIEIHNARMLSKDAFWNCDHVTVYDSFISGEYLGWNSKNLTFINCTIESLQGLCYAENVVMKNCRMINTTLAFEYSMITSLCSSSLSFPNSSIELRISSVISYSSCLYGSKFTLLPSIANAFCKFSTFE